MIQNHYNTNELYWIEYTPHVAVKFEDHVRCIAYPGIWRIRIELQAASDFFFQYDRFCVLSKSLAYILMWGKNTVPRYCSAVTLPACLLTPMFLFSTFHFLFILLSKCATCNEDTKVMPPAIIARKSDQAIFTTDNYTCIFYFSWRRKGKEVEKVGDD